MKTQKDDILSRFSIHEIFPIEASSHVEDGCDLCQHCFLLQFLTLHHESLNKYGVTSSQTAKNSIRVER